MAAIAAFTRLSLVEGDNEGLGHGVQRETDGSLEVCQLVTSCHTSSPITSIPAFFFFFLKGCINYLMKLLSGEKYNVQNMYRGK